VDRSRCRNRAGRCARRQGLAVTDLKPYHPR
jgi:hypothetical protein